MCTAKTGDNINAPLQQTTLAGSILAWAMPPARFFLLILKLENRKEYCLKMNESWALPLYTEMKMAKYMVEH